MVSRARRHMSYANVMVTLALIFAMTGGAYAAKHYIITSEKQISPSVLKKLQGKTGSAGKVGAVGAVGSVGPGGPAGPVGPAGREGSVGKEGPAGATGPTGTTGPEGSPWTANGTLPVGSSEKGVWSVAQYVGKGWGEGGEEEIILTPISFGIPLAGALNGSHVHYIGPGGTPPSGCSGSVTNPGAASGNLCVFTQEISKTFSFFPAPEIIEVAGAGGADPFGARIRAIPESKGEFSGNGSWAVTG